MCANDSEETPALPHAEQRHFSPELDPGRAQQSAVLAVVMAAKFVSPVWMRAMTRRSHAQGFEFGEGTARPNNNQLVSTFRVADHWW